MFARIDALYAQVGEGTNDVELVIKCVLWWKEEMKHDPGWLCLHMYQPTHLHVYMCPCKCHKKLQYHANSIKEENRTPFVRVCELTVLSAGFIPRSVPQDIKKEFTEFCEAFDLTQAFDSVMPLLLRCMCLRAAAVASE